MRGIALAVILGLIAVTPASGVVPSQPEPLEERAQAEAAIVLENLDFTRLVSDPPYAQQMLRHLDALSGTLEGDPTARAVLEGMRALALTTLDRDDESRALIRSVLGSGLREAEPYTMVWAAASHVPDVDLMLEVIEAIARNVAPPDRATVLPALAPPMVFAMNHQFREREADAQMVRLAEVLVAMDWPGDHEPEARDAMRKQLLDQRLRQGRREDAARIAPTITTPDTVLPMLLLRRYDGMLVDAGGRHVAVLERLLAEHDRRTAALLAASPQDYSRVLRRAQHLRSIGREADALAILSPFTADIAGTVAHDTQGMWIVNEAAYALLALHRPDEAVALMASLEELDLREYPDLIGTSINYAAVLWQAGRPAQSLAHIERLDTVADQHANAYGRMWISSSAVCSFAALGRAEEARARVRSMEGHREDNPAALTRAFLCLNDLDAAERVVVARLESDEPGEAILALQDYRAGGADIGPAEVLAQRLLTLRERPAVRAAIERTGRLLSLPLARIYYGGL